MSVLERVDARDFLEALGIEVDSVSGDNLVFLCPFHHERHPSARMNFKTTAWLCSVGCGKGNAIHFLAQLRGMSFEEARDHIHARYGIGPGAPIDDLELEVRRNLSGAGEVDPARVLPDESWVSYLGIDWEVDREHPAALYMYERGFFASALERWQVGYDPLSRRVSIPVRDVDGQLVGFKGRALGDVHPRYMILGDPVGHPSRYGFHTYRKSEYVFGLDRCIQALAWQRSCWVVEGELNAIAMWERFGQCAVAVAGSEFSDRQRELIATHCDHVVIYFDDDVLDHDGKLRDRNPGRLGAAKVASALIPSIDVDIVLGVPEDAAAIDRSSFEDLVPVPAMQLGVRGELDLALTT